MQHTSRYASKTADQTILNLDIKRQHTRHSSYFSDEAQQWTVPRIDYRRFKKQHRKELYKQYYDDYAVGGKNYNAGV